MTDAMRIVHMPRAGKRVPIGERAATCFQEIKKPLTPPTVRKFRRSFRPEIGRTRVHHGKANDPKVADALIHGLCSNTSQTAAVIINPPPLSKFQQTLQEFGEAVYNSKKKAPLGRPPDCTALPTWYNEKTKFGMKTPQDEDVGHILYPPKTMAELEKEEQDAHKVYVHTHNGYFVGEQKDRKYNYNKDSCFGIKKPFYNDGRGVGRCLRWVGESMRIYNPNPEWKRSPDSREKLEQQIGNMSNKKRGNNVKVPPDHTFGLFVPQDEYNVGDLIHSPQKLADKRERADGRQRPLASTVRNRLKHINFQNFPSLPQAFRYYDKKGRGRIDKEDLQEVCSHFDVVASEAVLDDVMEDCDLDKDGFINFLEFANFLTWKEKMPLNRRDQHLVMDAQFQTGLDHDPKSQSSGRPSSGPLLRSDDLEMYRTGSALKTVRTLSRPEPISDRFITTTSTIGAAGGKPKASKTRTCGVPSIRTDIVPPRYRKIDDNINYGDMATVVDLLLPSVYGRQGVYQDHLYCPRSKKEIAEIFGNMGANIPEKTFEEAWKLASMRHPDGHVCVGAFLKVLKEIQALQSDAAP